MSTRGEQGRRNERAAAAGVSTCCDCCGEHTVARMTNPAPGGVTTRLDGNTLVVSIRRRSFDTVVNSLCSLFLLAIPLPIVQQAPAVAAALSLPLFAFVYMGLTSVVNHDTVTLGRTLEVRTGPLPSFGSITLDTARITSIEPRAQRVTRRRVSYNVVALIDGVPHVIVTRLRVAERAQSAAKILNSHLAALRAAPAA